MTPEKRKKIKALLNNRASTENEKAVCRQILKDNPAPAPKGMFHTMPGRPPIFDPNPRSAQAQWADHRNRPYVTFESDQQFRHQAQAPWVKAPDGLLDGLFGEIAGLGQQYAAQRQQAAAQAQQDALRRDAERRQQDLRKSTWEKFRDMVYQSTEDRDRVRVLQREAIRNTAQQRLVELLKKKK